MEQKVVIESHVADKRLNPVDILFINLPSFSPDLSVSSDPTSANNVTLWKLFDKS